MIASTGVKAHDDAVVAAEMTRQVLEKAAAGNQAAVTAAWAAYYRSLLASAKANGLTEGQGEFIGALKALGANP